MAEISWESVRDEAVGYLCDLLRIDTTNPPGNERAACLKRANALDRTRSLPPINC